MGGSTSIPDGYQNYIKSTNYFDARNTCHDKDKTLYKRLIAEAYNLHGVTMIFYVTSYDTSHDSIFGEDNNRRFIRRFKIQTMYELPREDELWTKFGIEGIDNFHMFAAKESFAAMSTTVFDVRPGAFSMAFASSYDQYFPQDTTRYEEYDEYTPKAGDILKAEYNDYYYEIVDVGEEAEMFLQGKHSWDFIVRPYKDEHLSLGAAVSATEVSGVTDQTDILSVSADVDSEKSDILYEPPGTEEDSNDILGGW